MNSAANNKQATGNDVLADYLCTQERQRFPEALFGSGLLLSATLLTMFCLAGGAVRFITTVCVLILGIGLGIALEHHLIKTIGSRIQKMCLPRPLLTQPMVQPA